MKAFFINYLVIFLAFISSATHNMQPKPNKKIIKGVVSEKIGPLPSATLKIKGTKRETYTGSDGKFEIEVTEGEIIIVSYIGFQTAEVIVDSKDFYNVFLPEYRPPVEKRRPTKRQIEAMKSLRNGGL